MRSKAQSAGLDLEIDSAGTSDWHAGKPPDARAIVAARLRGYNIEGQRARALGSADFKAFDLIIAMDDSNRETIEALRPAGSTVPVVLMSSFAPDAGPTEVPDPYYTGKFDPVIAQLEACLDALLAQLLTERQ